MKKMITTLAALSCISAFAGDMSLNAVTQVKAKSGEGSSYGTSDHRGLKFSLGEISLTLKATSGKAFVKTKFEADTSSAEVKDAIVGYKFNHHAILTAGNFKVPTNYEYNISSSETDFVGHGLTGEENFSRNLGMMISGEILMGLSYDIGQWNSNGNGETGKDNVIAARLKYDRDAFHFETSWATKQEKGDDETSKDFAASYKQGKIMAKAEYIMVSNVSGNTKDQNAWQLTAGYQLCDKSQILVKHEVAEHEVRAAGKTTTKDLANTTIGLNYMPEKGMKLSLNYIIAGGDKDKFTGSRSNGYVRNAVAALVQMKF